ncbi:cytochrome ubiquinol oxidase subunit I [Chachezhania antarctica]|uniref:cytochrome ubiquinol oxidase subunit I n=1 Tax=Chachezhania antarctica TaxID=2340860 RepID=UPI0013CF3BF4|nr:cytochrome ubiquinol oxidase subunit I [Chachezhania antarctica]
MLSRTQFGILASFHMLFPAITLALGWVLCALYAQALWQTDVRGTGVRGAGLRDMRRVRAFWTRVQALAFGLSAVSGLALASQSQVLRGAEPLISPLAGSAFMAAFAFQSIGLSLLLMRRTLPRRRVQAAAGLMIATGATLWSLVLIGLGIGLGGALSGVTIPELTLAAVLSSVLTVGCLIAGLTALRILTGERTRAQRGMLRTGLWMVAIAAPLLVLLSADTARLSETAAIWFSLVLVAMAGLSWATLGFGATSRSMPGMPPYALLIGVFSISFAGWPITLLLWHGAVPLEALAPLPLPAGVVSDLPQTMVAYAAVSALLVAFFCAATLGMARNAASERSTRQGLGLLPAE